MYQIDWMKCKGGKWCDLFKINLESTALKDGNGVYVIWTGKDGQDKILRVGHGNLSEELIKARENLAIQAFRHIGVPVAIAEIPEEHSAGVATYLNKKLKPAINIPIEPKDAPIRVRTPFEI